MTVLGFDPDAFPRRWIRVIGGAATACAIVFGLVTAYLYLEAQRTLATPAKDIEAMLAFMKFLFLFMMTAATGTLAVMFAFVAARCWLART